MCTIATFTLVESIQTSPVALGMCFLEGAAKALSRRDTAPEIVSETQSMDKLPDSADDFQTGSMLTAAIAAVNCTATPPVAFHWVHWI
jgi:hypothetical protein